MADHVVDNDFVDLESIEPAGPSKPESTVSGEESENLQDQDFNGGISMAQIEYIFSCLF